MNKEIIVPIAVVALSVAFLDPFMVLMPESVVYICVVLLFLASLSYSLLIWHEKPADEREYMHRAYAGRIAYLTGVIALVVGILYHVIVIHQVDIFLVITLASMTVAKYAARRHIDSVS